MNTPRTNSIGETISAHDSLEDLPHMGEISAPAGTGGGGETAFNPDAHNETTFEIDIKNIESCAAACDEVAARARGAKEAMAFSVASHMLLKTGECTAQELRTGKAVANAIAAAIRAGGEKT